MEFKRIEYLNKLKNLEFNGLIKVITGMRRSGKSYILNNLFYKELLKKEIKKENIIRFRFDNDEDIDKLEIYFKDEPTRIFDKNGNYVINSKKFRMYIKENTNEKDNFYLLLDEVQLLENFSGTLNSYLYHNNFDVYVSGSNSKFLSNDIATTFSGRSSLIHVYPLTYKEIFETRNDDKISLYNEYLNYGGLPLVVNEKDEINKQNFLKNLIKSTYLKDIALRNNIKNDNNLNELFDIIASSSTSYVSQKKLSNSFTSIKKKTIDDETIKKYIDLYIDSFLINKSIKYSIKGKKFIDSPYKLYFEDLGVKNAKLDFLHFEESHLLENLVYNELLCNDFSIQTGSINEYIKTEKKDINKKDIYKNVEEEIDFIASKGIKKYYIQVTMSLNNENVRFREIRSLSLINDSFQKVIIVKDQIKPYRNEDGILVISIFDFLLDINSLNL